MGKATLFLAAGHGGTDRGNTSAGIVERDELVAFTGTIRRWYSLIGIPQQLGGAIFLDDELDLLGELKVLETWKLSERDGDLAVDLHLDFRQNSSGALVLYDESAIGRRVGETFLQRWCAATGIRNNGAYRSADVARPWRGWDDFGFCRPRWPGIIVELGCLNSPNDMAIVRNPLFQALAGQFLWEAWRA